MSASDLREAWGALWLRLGAVGEPFAVYEGLVQRYAKPGRAYHNLAHIGHCLSELRLTELRSFSERGASLDAIEFAIWFHDAVYDSKSKDNEERSAGLAREAVRRAALPDSFAEAAALLILITKHAVLPAREDERIQVDIDLSIRGQQRVRFEEYERQIREEYAWAPDDLYRKGRSAVLSSFFARPAIYSTEVFRGKYETRARENLAWSIARLAE